MATSPYFSKKRKLSEPDPLEELLQAPINPTPDELGQYFRDLSNTILNNTELVIKAKEAIKRFRILELEIYFQSDSHADPFCHAREIQAHSGLWYFHRSGNAASDSKVSQTSAGGYRGGTRKGLDITFGNEQSRAGILLRSMQDLDNQSVICGPSKLVDTILSFNGASNIRALVELYEGDVSILQSPREHDLYLRLSPTHNTLIYASPRIGLDLARASETNDPRVLYIDKPYRFFSRPEALKVAGRPQTFLALYKHFTDKEDIISRGFSTKVVDQYIEAYEGGKQQRLDKWLGKKGSLSPAQWLSMAGALESNRKRSLASGG